ncbi:unnamed protein product [Phaeothamnion confervicola]
MRSFFIVAAAFLAPSIADAFQGPGMSRTASRGAWRPSEAAANSPRHHVAVVRKALSSHSHREEEGVDIPKPAQGRVGADARSHGALAGGAAFALAVAAAAAEPALAAAPGWVAPTRLALDPALLYFEFAFVCRIVLSWYPQTDLNKAPQNLVAWPTEPLLRPTRQVVPPAFGVDVSPIVWVMICSFLREILLGQQGLLTLLSNK